MKGIANRRLPVLLGRKKFLLGKSSAAATATQKALPGTAEDGNCVSERGG